MDVHAEFPVVMGNITWGCVGAGGATCTASGAGQTLSDTLTNFPAGGVVTYTVSAEAVGNAIMDNTVTITPPEDVFDVIMSNNRATRPTVYRIILPIIFRNVRVTP